MIAVAIIGVLLGAVTHCSAAAWLVLTVQTQRPAGSDRGQNPSSGSSKTNARRTTKPVDPFVY